MNNRYRSWAEIDLDALSTNYHKIRQIIGNDRKMMAMVKADAYGHGAYQVAETLERLGVDYFGVACCAEAVKLREMGINTPILITGRTDPELAPTMAKLNITQTVYNIGYAHELSEYMRDSEDKLTVHIKLDTGMSRFGIRCPDLEASAVDEICDIVSLKELDVEGIYTHFALADSVDSSFFDYQFDIFMSVLKKAESKNIKFKIKHCANSACVLNYPCTYLDMVRPGLLLYGVSPTDHNDVTSDFIPVMTLKTTVAQLKRIPRGAVVSYGCKYCAESERTLAVVSIGYADGFMRMNSSGGRMLVSGQPAPVAGTVCMDACMLDVTGIDVKEGDVIEVFGKNYSVEKTAAACQTICYEVLTVIGKRIPRYFYENGTLTAVSE